MEIKLKEEIIKYCNDLGVKNIGFIKCRRFSELEPFYIERKKKGLENEFEEQNVNLRIDSENWFDGGKTIISMAFPYLSIYENNNNGFSVYTKCLDYHFVLNKYLSEIIHIIERHGGRAEKFVDSNTLPERYLAYISGVGFIGKNNLIITKEYGSYVFLGEIITDLELFEDDKRSYDEINNFAECKDCNICYEECPTKAINKYNKNCNICLSYITQKKELNNTEIKLLNGRMFGCDTCQLKCPYNNDVDYSKIKEFQVNDFMNDINEDRIISMGNTEFKNTYKITSCGWRGKNVLKRNAIIRKALFLKKGIESVKSDSPYIQKYIDILNKK